MRIAHFLLLCYVCVGASVASAHGTGASYETVVGGYNIDIGYSVEEPEKGELVRFDFSLTNVSTASSTPTYTDVWVTITKDNEIFFSGNLGKPYVGVTGLNIRFPDGGNYLVTADFRNDARTLAEASFIYSVRSQQLQSILYIGVSLVFLVGLLFGFLVLKRA